MTPAIATPTRHKTKNKKIFAIDKKTELILILNNLIWRKFTIEALILFETKSAVVSSKRLMDIWTVRMCLNIVRFANGFHTSMVILNASCFPF